MAPAFTDLSQQYRSFGEGGEPYPSTMFDEFDAAYAADTGGADAKIQQLTVENAALAQQLNEQKAANYDLYMAANGAPAEGADADADGDSDNTDPEEGPEKTSDLFTSDKEND